MTKSVTCEEMARLDAVATDRYGIPSLLLMENAGRSVFEEIDRLRRRGSVRELRIFCGKGNNGGDGYVVARHCHNAGLPVRVFLFGERQAVPRESDAGRNLTIVERMGIGPVEIRDESGLRASLDSVDAGCLVVDAVFGTGLSGEVRGLPRTWIERVNSLPCSRLSVDIPSGLDGDEGHVLGASVRAHMTVTFGLPKRGLLTGEGPSVTGFLVVADISIPREELESARDA